jgi:hypothetical protein
MSTKKRVIGISAAATEAARRQLMQPVACWEHAWVPLENAPHIKIYKWVKTDKVQQFNDDEGTVDEPLAPLPDEQDGDVVEVEGDEEGMAVDQDQENTAPEAAVVVEKPDELNVPSTVASGTRDASDDAAIEDSSKPTTPVMKPNPLSMDIPLSDFDDNLEPGPSAHEDEETGVAPMLSFELDEGPLEVPAPDENTGLVLDTDNTSDMPHTDLGLGPDEVPMTMDMSGIVSGELDFVGEVPQQHDPPQIEGSDEGMLGPILEASIDSFTANKEQDA